MVSRSGWRRHSSALIRIASSLTSSIPRGALPPAPPAEPSGAAAPASLRPAVAPPPPPPERAGGARPPRPAPPNRGPVVGRPHNLRPLPAGQLDDRRQAELLE